MSRGAFAAASVTKQKKLNDIDTWTVIEVLDISRIMVSSVRRCWKEGSSPEL